MKALTVYQPWASLIIACAKPYEFRGWDFSAKYPSLVGQRVIIHASTRKIRPAEIEDMRHRIENGESGLVPAVALALVSRLQRAYRCQGVLELGAGLGTAILGKPRPVTDIFSGVIDSDRLDHSKWGWPLTDVRPFPLPQPCPGAQGFWNWPFEHRWAA